MDRVGFLVPAPPTRSRLQPAEQHHVGVAFAERGEDAFAVGRPVTRRGNVGRALTEIGDLTRRPPGGRQRPEIGGDPSVSGSASHCPSGEITGWTSCHDGMRCRESGRVRDGPFSGVAARLRSRRPAHRRPFDDEVEGRTVRGECRSGAFVVANGDRGPSVKGRSSGAPIATVPARSRCNRASAVVDHVAPAACGIERSQFPPSGFTSQFTPTPVADGIERDVPAVGRPTGTPRPSRGPVRM